MAIKVANNNSLSAITALPAAVSGGAMTLLETQTASSSSTISFTSNIDSTYDEYVFKFYNIHPATNDVLFRFNGSIDGGSNYNVTKTTTFFDARHREGDSATNLEYTANRDLAQSTDFQNLNYDTGNQNDEDVCGYLHLFSPSSNTFVKHFMSRFIGNGQAEDCQDSYVAGYFNDTNDINAIQFKFSSGDIDSGVIKLYGIS